MGSPELSNRFHVGGVSVLKGDIVTDEYIVGLFHIHIISVESIIETDEVLSDKS